MKKQVRSARLNEVDDQKFLKLHQLYKMEHEMKSGENADLLEWTYAHTLTMLIREMYVFKEADTYDTKPIKPSEEMDRYDRLTKNRK